MSQTSEFGVFTHSSHINDYLTIFSRNFERISEVVFEGVDIITSEENSVIYLTRSFTKMEQGGIKLSRLDKRKNQFFVIMKEHNDWFEYQGKKYWTKGLPTLTNKATVDNFLYAYAYNLYYQGETQQCLDIIGKTIKDKALVDKQMSSFTYDECGDFTKALLNAVLVPKDRYSDGECPLNYVPKNDAICVMDILGILQRGNNFYIPFSKNVEKYSRITKKNEDTFNVFKMTDEEVRVPFGSFVYNKSHLNLSFLCYIPGIVKLNPKAAKAVKLPTEIKSGIFRNYALIKDGMLNMKKIEVIVDQDTYDELTKVPGWQLFTNVLIDLNREGGTYRLLFNFEMLPVINRMYIEDATVDNLFDTVVQINVAEATQKVINYYLTKVMNEGTAALKKQSKFADYNADQIKVLQEHGLNEDLNYNSVATERKSNDECDFYLTRTMEFSLAGCSSLPKIEEMQERVSIGAKLTFSMQILKKAYDTVLKMVSDKKLDINTPNVALRDQLQLMQSTNKENLIVLRNKLNCLKMAKLLTGDSFKGFKVNEKKKDEYLYEKDGMTLVAKIKKDKVYL